MTSPLPPIPPLSRLTPLIYRLTGGNPSKFTLQGTNTYLLGRGAHRILIDTGQGFPIWSETLHKLLLDESTSVTTVLLTHHHADHTDGLKDIPQPQDPAVEQKAWRFPAPPSTDIYREMLARAVEAWNRPTDTLSDGMTFPIPGAEGVVLRTIHTPGHTPDHCSFLLEAETSDVAEREGVQPVLFTGDAVLGHGTAVFEDLAVYMSSLQKMLDVVSAAGKGGAVTVQVFPAHGEVIVDAEAKIGEYIEHRAQREQQVLDVLSQDDGGDGLLPMDLVKVIYKEYPESLHAPAEGGVKLILAKLLGEGRVEQMGERWKVVGEEKRTNQKAGL